MTLYRLLIDRKIDYLMKSIKNFRDTHKSDEYSGKADMCGELLDLLSEETLQTEVLTKEEALARKAANAVVVTEEGIAW